MSMLDELQALKESFQAAVKEVTDSERLEELRVEYLGRKGKLASALKELPNLAEDVRKEAGKAANQVKQALELAFSEVQRDLGSKEGKAREQSEWVDITEPGIRPEVGHLHLTTQAIDEITNIFRRIGFQRVRHPEIDWAWYAFESLNMPATHPARDEWETFFIADGEEKRIGTEKQGEMVLTPHTSNGQVRQMEKGEFPIRMLNIAKTYRRQAGVRHLPMFHQFEGLYIDKVATITQLKGVLDFFVKEFFGQDREIRLRPYHFRFTEPSFELDISAEKGQEDSKLYKDGWLELGGAGMVHPHVIASAGLDPNEYSGFAFGFGVERPLMVRSGININDIRLLYKNDLRFLEQF